MGTLKDSSFFALLLKQWSLVSQKTMAVSRISDHPLLPLAEAPEIALQRDPCERYESMRVDGTALHQSCGIARRFCPEAGQPAEALICQEEGLVPMVEPDIIMKGPGCHSSVRASIIIGSSYCDYPVAQPCQV